MTTAVMTEVTGGYTRAEVDADLGVKASLRESFERRGHFGPSERRRRGDTTPVRYTSHDLAVARTVVAAYRLGVVADGLQRVRTAMSAKRGKLTPGWAGFLLVDEYGDGRLLANGDDLSALLTSPQGSLVLPVRVPAA